MISLRKTLAQSAPSFEPTRGVRNAAVGGPITFPFKSMRTLADSRVKPERFEYSNIFPRPNSNVPRVDSSWDSEAQGVQYVGDLMYLVTKNAVWVTQLRPGPDLTPIPGSYHVEESLLDYYGRKHLRDTKAKVGPIHMGAPAVFLRFLLVPAEGTDGEYVWRTATDRVVAERLTRVQWVWVFDLSTLRYVCRIALDSVASEQNDELPWLGVSEETGLLYSSRYNTYNKDVPRYTSEVTVFRLPDVLREMADDDALPLAEGMAIDEAEIFPTLQAEYVGSVPILRDGERLYLKQVTGGTFSANGNIYVAYQRIWDWGTRSVQKDWGVVGFDALTGDVFAYVSADLSATDLQGVAVHGDRLSVCAWEAEAVGTFEYQVAHFRAIGGAP